MKELLKEKISKITVKKFGVQAPDFLIEVPQKEEFGDFSANIAFILSKELKKSPREIAEVYIGELLKVAGISKAEVAGAGFINIFVGHDFYENEIKKITKEKSSYGSNKIGKGKKVQVEFLSANPTGPIHIGNGRCGYSGMVLAEVLKKNGYKAEKEYYVNNAGNQVKKILAKSIWSALDIDIKLEEGEKIYSGDYIEDTARKIKKEKGLGWIRKNFSDSGVLASKIILDKYLKKDLESCDIKYDKWFSEEQLFKKGYVKKMWELLKKKNLVYEQDGAYWLKTSNYGDEKDRVVKTSDGNFTYLMSDMAYTYERLGIRKYNKVIMILGADHHGYVGRLQAVAEILGFKGKLDVVITQFLFLLKDGQEVRMSKRRGSVVTFKDGVDAIGKEAAKYFLISKDYNQHIDLDIDLARSESNKNPIFYIQYANARIASVLSKLKSKSTKPKLKKSINGEFRFDKYELALAKRLIQYPEIIKEIGESYQVYKLAFFAHELATDVHKFYENCKIVGDERERIRTEIIKATKVVLEDCLGLMGIKAKKKM